MANLKSIRSRISTVRSTRQITSAMKMVAAARLRKSQDRLIQMRPYARKLQEVLSNIRETIDDNGQKNIYCRESAPEKVVILLFSSNRGLCGGFNTQVIKEVKRLIADDYRDQFEKGNVSFIAIGKKGYDYLSKLPETTVEEFSHIYNRLAFGTVSQLASAIMDDFAAGKSDKVVLVYNQFRSAATQNLVAETFLPVSVVIEDDDTPVISDYLFEPGKEQILDDIIPRNLKLQFYRALLESATAENGARMTAMHKATDNATEMIDRLTLQYNKARQSAITNQILEVAGGAEAQRAE